MNRFTNFLYVLTCLGLFCATKLSSQIVSDKQVILFSKITADWCPKCGDYGWSLFKNLEVSLKDKDVLVLAVHKSSSSIKTNTSAAWSDNYGGVAQPLWFINDAEVVDVNASNWQSKQREIEELVPVIKSLGSAFAGVNTLVTPKTNGKYNLIAPQTNQAANAKHTGVLRNNVLDVDAPFGERIMTGPINKDQEIFLEKDNISIDIGTGKATDYRLATVLWRKNGTKYIYFNAAIQPLTPALVDAKDIVLNKSFALEYNKMTKQIILNAHDRSVPKDFSIKAFDVQGKLIASNQLGLALDVSKMKQGVYFISANDAMQQLATSKIYID